jgi:hypothetical protein
MGFNANKHFWVPLLARVEWPFAVLDVHFWTKYSWHKIQVFSTKNSKFSAKRLHDFSKSISQTFAHASFYCCGERQQIINASTSYNTTLDGLKLVLCRAYSSLGLKIRLHGTQIQAVINSFFVASSNLFILVGIRAPIVYLCAFKSNQMREKLSNLSSILGCKFLKSRKLIICGVFPVRRNPAKSCL